MTSISCEAIAGEVLAQCLAGRPPGVLPPALAEDACSPALFSILVEGLADRFEPALCDTYVRLFSQAIAHVSSGVDPAALVARYQHVRRLRAVTTNPGRIFVLSRVTLGADVAVTSVILAAARQQFPDAEIFFVAPHKNYELFSQDPRIQHATIVYHRGSLRDRLASARELRSILAAPDSVVIDPDSRLTQLGILEVCDPNRYFFFESRAYRSDSNLSLAELTSAWTAETLGTNSQPYVAVPPSPRTDPYIAVSFGVGENPAKRLPDPFEEKLLALLARRGMPLWIDKGAGGEESERVIRAVERSGVDATFWDGSFAGFASIISGARLYVGYDSAGQHVAAACSVPLISIFAGFPALRMFHRWRVTGPHTRVIRIDRPDPGEALALVERALTGFPAA